VDIKLSTSGVGDAADEVLKTVLGVIIIHTQATFHAHTDVHGLTNRSDQICYQGRFTHETGTEAPTLDSWRWAANVQVDFIEAASLGQPGGCRQIPGITAAELDGQRMLERMESQQPVLGTIQEGTGRNHFGKKQGFPTAQARQIAAVSVCPRHHRCDCQFGGWPDHEGAVCLDRLRLQVFRAPAVASVLVEGAWTED
jgi:hypothetical protein